MSVGIFLATPTFDGKFHWSTTAGLMQVAQFCGKVGMPLASDVVPGDHFVDKARNTLVYRFLKTNLDEIVFIDADVGFDINGFKLLMKSNVDIAMGLYRVKDDRVKFPALLHEPVEAHPEDPRLVKLQYGPAGFMKVRRRVFEKMIEQYPEDYYYAGEAEDSRVYEFFPSGRKGHHYGGEDIKFCERAIACGFSVWAVQDIPLDHTGAKTYDAKWRVLRAVEEAA